MNPPNDLAAEDVAREFLDWDISNELGGLLYARLRDAEPPVVVRGEDPTDLRDEILRKIGHTEQARWLARGPRDHP
jgi:hypothetical protein